MLTFGINNFHLTHETHCECRICKPIHFSILEEETVGFSTGGYVELNPLKAVDSRYDFPDIRNLSNRSHPANNILHHA